MTGEEKQMHPAKIAHEMLGYEGHVVRFFLEDQTMTVPVPTERSVDHVETPVASFEALVKEAWVDDGGLLVDAFLDLSDDEFERLKLDKVWEAADLDTGRHARQIEFVASRHDSLASGGTDVSEPPVPDDSPILTEWRAHKPETEPDQPPAFEQPYLITEFPRPSGDDFERIRFAEIAGIEVVERDRSENEEGAYPPSQTLEALWTVNQLAKEYAQDAAESYDAGFKGMANSSSARKEALYALKSAVLATWFDDESITIDSIERHEIDGRDYYCLRIGEYSFHTPVSDWGSVETVNRQPDPPAVPHPSLEDDDVDELAEFDSTSSHDQGDMSEQEALSHLATQVGYSPNDFLRPEWDTDSRRPRYIGWDNLPRARSLGDRMPKEEVREEFIFEIGDTLSTLEHGTVTIEDQYGVLSTPPFRTNSVPRPRPHYDVQFEATDELQEAVSQKDVFGWDIRLGDPASPTIPEHLLDHIVHQEVPFAPGDEIELERRDGTEHYTIDELFFTGGGIVMVVLVSEDGEEIRRAVDELPRPSSSS